MSEKLKKIDNKIEEKYQECRKVDGQYTRLMAKIRKRITTPIDNEIEVLKTALLETTRKRQEVRRSAYLQNKELQCLKKKKEKLWEELRKLQLEWHELDRKKQVKPKEVTD